MYKNPDSTSLILLKPENDRLIEGRIVLAYVFEAFMSLSALR